MVLYRLHREIAVQRLTFSLRADYPDNRRASLDEAISAGAIVEVVSAPSKEGRLLIRHNGVCYRAWKEDLRDSHIAERISSRTSAPERGHAAHTKAD